MHAEDSDTPRYLDLCSKHNTFQMGGERRDEFVRIVFRVKKISRDPTSEHLGIMGNHARLGNWDTVLAPTASFIGHSQWQMETWLPSKTVTHFKLFCFDPRSHHVLHIEDGPNRELDVKDTSLFIELEYNNTRALNTRPMVSRLTPTGQPFVLTGLKLNTEKYSPTAGDWDMDDCSDDQNYYTPELHTSCGKLFVQFKNPPNGNRCDGSKANGKTTAFEMTKYNVIDCEKPVNMSPKADGKVYGDQININSNTEDMDDKHIKNHLNSTLHMTTNYGDKCLGNPSRQGELGDTCKYSDIAAETIKDIHKAN